VTCKKLDEQLADAQCPETTCAAVAALERAAIDDRKTFEQSKISCAKEIKALDEGYVTKLASVMGTMTNVKQFAAQMFDWFPQYSTTYDNQLLAPTKTPTVYPTVITSTPTLFPTPNGTRPPTGSVTVAPTIPTYAPDITYWAPPPIAAVYPDRTDSPMLDDSQYGQKGEMDPVDGIPGNPGKSEFMFLVDNQQTFNDAEYGCGCARKAMEELKPKADEYKKLRTDTAKSLSARDCDKLKAFVCDNKGFMNQCGKFLYGKENIHNSVKFFADCEITCTETSSGMSAGAVAGTVIGVLCGIGLLVACAVYFKNSREQHSIRTNDMGGNVDL
jgi:hypothetical protein